MQLIVAVLILGAGRGDTLNPDWKGCGQTDTFPQHLWMAGPLLLLEENYGGLILGLTFVESSPRWGCFIVNMCKNDLECVQLLCINISRQPLPTLKWVFGVFIKGRCLYSDKYSAPSSRISLAGPLYDS